MSEHRCQVVILAGTPDARRCELPATAERDGHPVCEIHALSHWRLPWILPPIHAESSPTHMALVETVTR